MTSDEKRAKIWEAQAHFEFYWDSLSTGTDRLHSGYFLVTISLGFWFSLLESVQRNIRRDSTLGELSHLSPESPATHDSTKNRPKNTDPHITPSIRYERHSGCWITVGDRQNFYTLSRNDNWILISLIEEERTIVGAQDVSICRVHRR